MAKQSNFNDSDQLSLFDRLLAEMNKAGTKMTANQIATIINKLKSAKDVAKKREERERAQKKKEEAEKQVKSTKKAVKKVNDNLEKTTLGDVTDLAKLKSELSKAEKENK